MLAILQQSAKTHQEAIAIEAISKALCQYCIEYEITIGIEIARTIQLFASNHLQRLSFDDMGGKSSDYCDTFVPDNLGKGPSCKS